MTDAAIRWVGVLALLSVAAAACEEESAVQTEAATSGKKVLFYRSPMDPSFVSKNPGKDNMNMDLVAVYEGDPGADLSTISLNGATIQRMGVRLAPVQRRSLVRVVRAIGRVEFDETRVTTVNMKFDGWIEKLWVNETGKYVKRHAPLLAVYSPELVASQEEYLQIRQNAASGPHSEHLVRAARQRLREFDVSRSLLKRIEQSGKSERRIAMSSPSSGYVIHKTAFEGTFVKKGTNLFTLGDLDALWVLADVFESDAPWIAPGQKASVELDYQPGHIQQATVDYVYPTLDKKSRTLQVRLLLPNPNVTLKPGMFATVRIHTEPVGKALVVPTSAVIHSGERNVAFVSKGEGRFEPRDLSLGVAGDDAYQVLSGLTEGEQVVVSGQFLLDSESRLKEAVKKMLGSNVGAEEKMRMPDGATMPSAAAEKDGGASDAATKAVHDSTKGGKTNAQKNH